jgi:hypothetical protein
MVAIAITGGNHIPVMRKNRIGLKFSKKNIGCFENGGFA